MPADLVVNKKRKNKIKLHQVIIGGIWAGKGERRRMSSSGVEPESPDLVCELDSVQGVVDALTSVRWKRHQVSLSLSQQFCLFGWKKVLKIKCTGNSCCFNGLILITFLLPIVP